MDPNQDQKRNNINDYINNLYSGIQNARMIGQLGRGGASGAGRVAATVGRAAPLLLNPVSLAIIGIVSVTIITVFVLGGQSSATEIPNPPVPATYISSALNISGDTRGQQNLIYKFFQETTGFPKYQNLLTSSGPVNISFDFDPGLDEGLCGGGVVGSDITFYNFPRSACGESGKKYLFLHESGHVIGNRNRDVYNSFALTYPSLKEQDNQADQKCYTDDGFLLSYQKEFGDIAGAENESFAESIALSILKKWKTFDNFPLNCPATYNWIKANVLDL